MDTETRFWSKVDRTGPCWLWLGATDGKGYGLVTINRVGRRAHRVAWEWANGPVPDGLQLDHLCRVRNCVRPDHLEPVTSRENTLRGATFAAANVAKTHCPAGHPYDAANTYRSPGHPRRRVCRACVRARQRSSGG